MTTALIRRAPLPSAGICALSRFDDLPRWVVWRNEPRQDDPSKFTKVPYQPSGRKASSTEPETWVMRTRAEGAVKTVINGHDGGGIGIVFGALGDDTMLAGIDLDSCRREDGSFEPWATEIIERFATYAEISPSGKGAKLFFYVLVATYDAIKDQLTGEKTGRQFKKAGGGDHPPGFEVYFLGRYFAVTEQHLEGTPNEIENIEADDLRWLLTKAGPALNGKGSGQKGTEHGSGPADQSRSAAALRLGLAMCRAGRSFDDFREALQRAPETMDWYTEKGAANGERELHRIWEKADNGLPTIRLVAGERPRIVSEAIDALDGADAPFYRRGLSIVNVAMIPAKTSDGSNITIPAIVPVPAQQLMHELGKAARWVKYDRRHKDWVPTDVPADVAAKIAALPNEWKFEPLSGIIATQTMRPDGSLLTETGYDEATGFLLFDPPSMPAIPDVPTRQSAHDALKILRDLLIEFPFADDPSRTVALSMLMTPVLRPALRPAVPLHVIRAPVGGSGKSYLADLASAIATGERCPVISRSPSFEETEKRLVGAALTGQPIISIDNCNGELRSEFLCQAVERPVLQVRALGTSELARIDNATTCLSNGNNIQIAEDLVRRSVQCSLDANIDRPETRKFVHDPLAAIFADRGRYVAAVLTIARAYVVAGMPHRPPPFASFDRWNELVRGALMWLGCADPCDTVAELSVADPVKNERAEVFQAIAKAMVDPDYTVNEIISAARKDTTLESALRMIASADGEISPRRLGKWLAASLNTIAGNFKLLRSGSVQNRVRWRLERVPR
jgi:hypothetical protein